MAAKTLSTSTLSLKFMQNAHRARNLKEVQLERAEVKDDGEWEVAQEVRDAWGPETTCVCCGFPFSLSLSLHGLTLNAHTQAVRQLRGVVHPLPVCVGCGLWRQYECGAQR
jgi:hypothetical protein